MPRIIHIHAGDVQPSDMVNGAAVRAVRRNGDGFTATIGTMELQAKQVDGRCEHMPVWTDLKTFAAPGHGHRRS